MAFPVNPIGGVDVTRVDSTPEFKVGSEHMNDRGTTFVYARIPYTSLTPNLLYQLDVAGAATSCVAGTAGTWYTLPTRFGVFQGGSPGTLTSASYGWFATRGLMSIANNAAVTVGAKTYTSAAAGYVNGAAGAHQNLIQGLVPTASANPGISNFYAIINLAAVTAS